MLKIVLVLIASLPLQSLRAAEIPAALPAELPAAQPGLPPSDHVMAALQAQPQVVEAKALLKAAQARARGLKAGPYETSVRLGLQNRSVSSGSNERFTEWEGILERPLRLPGKAKLDGRLGDAQVEKTSLAIGDALHEAGREFLKDWLEWSRQQESARIWQAQSALLRQQAEIVEKRIKAGDAPRLEREAARAALAQSESQQKRVELARDTVQAMLHARYPNLPTPEGASLATPAPTKGTLESWQTAVLRHNHELAWAQAGTRVSRLNASRLEANLRPDPAVGIRYSSERGGDEKVIGAFVSLPLSGAMRRSERDAARVEAEVAALKEATVARRLALEAESQYLAARLLYQSWQQASEAAVAATRQADGMTRAYQLGEASLSDTLMARKLALEAQLAESMARADSIEARYRLMLDAHQLWSLDGDEERGNVPPQQGKFGALDSDCPCAGLN